MFYADSHIHLQDYTSQDVNNIVMTAQKNNVCRFINASAYPDDWNKVADIAARYDFITPAYGVHPWYVKDAPKNWIAELEKMLKQNPRACVGECGIDSIRNKDLTAQLLIFEAQIALAHDYMRPLIIHAVKADEVLKKLFPILPEKTIFHSFTGSIEWGRQIQKQGFYIGLNFSVLRKKNVREIIQSLDLYRILLETDGPYQSGQKDIETLPQDLPKLAAQIADMLHMKTENLTAILEENWFKFVGENDA